MKYPKLLRGIHNIELSKATRGWRCEIYFSAPTRRQFTNEWHTVKAGHRFLLGAIFNGFVSVRNERRRLRLLPGAFELG